MKIHILGPGCPKCNQLAETATQAAKELGIEFELEKVSDFDKIMSFGVMMTPGLVIDGKVKSVGRVPSLTEIKNMIQ
ncbi:thioredoxin family protein [Desulforhopalus sp. IMCC35007]|uniref:thioredoxin family protein n=1 Tax=Desulforhopalus sp. IMCC35007 TaxID=2569543 RepID=UPI0010ADB868|nr:thioredoxin family protein [Desulforhopalus sp. IMCC35007]TKB10418.1 thioredoxin family protein [Desulforhopalus sp. IMCC35007]